MFSIVSLLTPLFSIYSTAVNPCTNLTSSPLPHPSVGLLPKLFLQPFSWSRSRYPFIPSLDITSDIPSLFSLSPLDFPLSFSLGPFRPSFFFTKVSLHTSSLNFLLSHQLPHSEKSSQLKPTCKSLVKVFLFRTYIRLPLFQRIDI